MDIELDKALCKKYPALYGQRRLPMHQTAMCWGFQCGDGWYKILDELSANLTAISKASGIRMQATTVKEKYGTLRFYLGNEDRCPGRPDSDAGKFAKAVNHLRWFWYGRKQHLLWKYYDFKAKLFPKYTEARRIRNDIWNDIIDACVNDAERKSSQTCEICGEYGQRNRPGPGGWDMTRCKQHWEGPGTYDDPDKDDEEEHELGKPDNSPV